MFHFTCYQVATLHNVNFV